MKPKETNIRGPLATCAAPSALVRDPRRGCRLLLGRLLLLDTNISSLLGKPLILELKVGVALDRGLPWLPSSVVCWHALPLVEDVPGALLEACSPHSAGS